LQKLLLINKFNVELLRFMTKNHLCAKSQLAATLLLCGITLLMRPA